MVRLLPILALAVLAAAAQSGLPIHRWLRGSPESTYKLVDNRYILTLSERAADVSVAVWDCEKYTCLGVSIVNRSRSRFDIQASNIVLYSQAPVFRELAYRRPETVVERLERSARWHAFALAFAEATAATRAPTDGSFGVDDSDGSFASGHASATTPDYEVRDRAYRLQDRLAHRTSDEIDRIEDMTLNDNTLEPGDRLVGIVYFERDPKAETALANVPVGPETFQFGIQWQR
jgi:hypothetical protein